MFFHLRFAVRSLLKTPGFTLVAVLIIAVAIGANTALFSIFNRLVLHPIDLPGAGRLVRLWTNNKERNLLAREGADPGQLNSLYVTASFLPTLGLPLARGRNFSAEEDQPGGPAVCILAYETWKTRFGLRETLLGETIALSGTRALVVGILPEKPPPRSIRSSLPAWRCFSCS